MVELQPVAMTVGKTLTIADIARIAGVDKSTVSRALNDSSLIAAGTRSESGRSQSSTTFRSTCRRSA